METTGFFFFQWWFLGGKDDDGMSDELKVCYFDVYLAEQSEQKCK